MKHLAEILRLAWTRLALLMPVILLATSCNGFIYDDEGDCEPHYKVRFKYDMNMKWADAFPNEVNEVTLYILNEDGKVVWTKHESGPAVKAEGYLMDVDVAPGTYTLLAWCGEGHTTSFAVTPDDLSCTLLRDRNAEDKAYIDHDINRLYHGKIDAQVFPDTEGDHVYTVPLIKNTNDIHVVLQHLSGDPVDKDQFTFTITSDNGLMASDNRLLTDETLTYYAWHTDQGVADVYYPTGDTKTFAQFSAAIAEFTVSRLVKGNDTRLTIYDKKGGIVLSIPLIDYFLLVKGHHNREMSDQEFLDRQDDYSIVFLLDEGNRWVPTVIYINSWAVVLQDVGL